MGRPAVGQQRNPCTCRSQHSQRFTDVTASRTLPAHRYPSSRSPSGGVRTSASLSVAFKLTPGSLRAALLCRFARRFLHPAVVSRYELLFVWDEDIGVSGFDANRRVRMLRCCVALSLLVQVVRSLQAGVSLRRFVQLVLEHGLDISQPAVGDGPVSWPITRRAPGSVMHRRDA